jgi:ferritin-like metal-binding protein YciE
MNTKTLKDLFHDELADMYDAEKRIVKALPKLAKSASCSDLKAALEKHLRETLGHVTKLEQVFKTLGMMAKGKTCEATKGLLEEGDEIAAEFKGSPAINAALIAACQKVEHYEIASYGCLHEWAGLLGNSKAAVLLETILDEEKATNEALNSLAVFKNNQEALCESCDPKRSEKVKKSPGKLAKSPMPKRLLKV